MKKRILIIEDSLTSSLLIDYTLKKEGYETKLASCVAEAVGLIKDSIPDIIVLDLNIPEVTGYDFLEMRKELNIEKVPVIIVSALDSPESITKTKALGVTEFMAKPLKVDLFVERVKAMIN